MDKVLRFKGLKITTMAVITENNIDFIRGDYVGKGAHIPSTGLSIYGNANLLTLRDALNDLYPDCADKAKLADLEARLHSFKDLEHQNRILQENIVEYQLKLAKARNYLKTEQELRKAHNLFSQENEMLQQEIEVLKFKLEKAQNG